MLISCCPLPNSPFENSTGMPAADHAVADLPDDPLVLGGLEHVVVHDVGGAGPQVLVLALGGLLVRVLEQVELELRPRLDHEAGVRRTLDLPLQDLPGRDLDRLVRVLVVDVADDHGRLLEPRAEPERREVGDHLEVAVAGLPARVLVAGQRLHLHVDRQQVEAGVEPFLAEHLLQEEVREHPLPLEASLQVREHAQDRVDLTGVGELLQLLDVEHSLGRHRGSPSGSRLRAVGVAPTALGVRGERLVL